MYNIINIYSKDYEYIKRIEIVYLFSALEMHLYDVL